MKETYFKKTLKFIYFVWENVKVRSDCFEDTGLSGDGKLNQRLSVALGMCSEDECIAISEEKRVKIVINVWIGK